jgi:hypothetical protein
MSNSLVIRYERGVLQLIFPEWFDRASLTHIRKAFVLLCTNVRENEEAVYALGRLLPLYVQEYRALWVEASRAYQNGYRDPTQHGKKESQAIQAANGRLLATVKKSKARYEKMCKIQTLFDTTKEKYHVI